MRTFIKRPGIEGLIEWLETTDFFAAPASTKYHGAHPEGLINHSMNVFNRMMRKHLDFPEGTRMETVAIRLKIMMGNRRLKMMALAPSFCSGVIQTLTRDTKPSASMKNTGNSMLIASIECTP